MFVVSIFHAGPDFIFIYCVNDCIIFCGENVPSVLNQLFLLLDICFSYFLDVFNSMNHCPVFCALLDLFLRSITQWVRHVRTNCIYLV